MKEVLHDSESVSFLQLRGKGNHSHYDLITDMCTQTANMDYWTGDLSQAYVTDR